MIPAFYRVTVHNSTGVSISSSGITVTARRWKYVSGVKTYDSVSTLFSLGSTLTNGSSISGSVIDNTFDKWEGADCLVTTILGSSGTGTVTVYLDASPDGTNFPDNGAGCPLASIYYAAASGTKKTGSRL
jgi:hypothetical protein